MAIGSKKEKATLKLAKGKAATTSGTATVNIKVPAGGRVVAGGQGWFETPHLDDYFMVYIVDIDGITYPPGTIIGSYTDTDADTANQGAYIPKGKEYLEITKLGDFGFIPENYYIQIIGYTGDSRVDNLRCNVQWGKRE